MIRTHFRERHHRDLIAAIKPKLVPNASIELSFHSKKRIMLIGPSVLRAWSEKMNEIFGILPKLEIGHETSSRTITTSILMSPNNSIKVSKERLMEDMLILKTRKIMPKLPSFNQIRRSINSHTIQQRIIQIKGKHNKLVRRRYNIRTEIFKTKTPQRRLIFNIEGKRFVT